MVAAVTKAVPEVRNGGCDQTPQVEPQAAESSLLCVGERLHDELDSYGDQDKR